MSQQAVSADVIQIQLLEYFPQKQKEQKQKQLGCAKGGYHANLEAFMLPTLQL
jgi:hypothetical protein